MKNVREYYRECYEAEKVPSIYGPSADDPGT